MTIYRSYPNKVELVQVCTLGKRRLQICLDRTLFKTNPILAAAFPNRGFMNSKLPTYMGAQIRKCQISPSVDAIKRLLEIRTVYIGVGGSG